MSVVEPSPKEASWGPTDWGNISQVPWVWVKGSPGVKSKRCCFLTVGQGSKYLSNPLPSKLHWQETGSGAEELGLEPALCWGCRCPKGWLTLLASVPTPPLFF